MRQSQGFKYRIGGPHRSRSAYQDAVWVYWFQARGSVGACDYGDVKGGERGPPRHPIRVPAASSSMERPGSILTLPRTKHPRRSSGFVAIAQRADSHEDEGSSKTGTADFDLLKNTVRLQWRAFRGMKRIPFYDENKGINVHLYPLAMVGGQIGGDLFSRTTSPPRARRTSNTGQLRASVFMRRQIHGEHSQLAEPRAR